MNKEKQIREETIMSILKALQDTGEIVREDKKASLDDKVIKMDVILDTMRFLNNYEENVKILNKYWCNKKFNFSKEDEQKER